MNTEEMHRQETFWELEFKLAKLADKLGATREELIINYNTLEINHQKAIRGILQMQIDCLLPSAKHACENVISLSAYRRKR